MTKFKKIIPALCMLLISAVLMGTSTYAWFSMNRTVTASGMQVTAQSNSRYLMIATGENKTCAAIQALTVNTTATVTGNNNLYPAAFNNSGKAIEVEDASKDTAEDANDGKTTIADKTWYTANSTAFDNATTRKTNVMAIDGTTLKLSDYVRTDTFYLALSQGSADYSNKKLSVAFVKGGTDDAALAVVVKIGEVYIKLDSTTASGDFTGITVPSTGNALEVTVYTYINGDSTNVNSAYVNGGHTITGTATVTFTLEA